MNPDPNAVATLPAQQSAASQMAVMQSSAIQGKYETDDNFDDLAKVGDYLPYLKLCGSNTVEAQTGKIPTGNHALVKGKQLIDMGKSVNCWICAWRPMALLTAGDKPVAFYDPNSEGFKKIRDMAAVPGKNDAMCGPQFLLYIPGHGFATYFMSSKTAKNEAPNFKALIDQCAVISAKFIETKKFSWHGATVVASSQRFETPDSETYLVELNKFKNPPESSVELADNQGQDADKREM